MINIIMCLSLLELDKNNAVPTKKFQQRNSNNVVQSFQQFNSASPNPILSTVNKSFTYGTRLF
jgi:hypothetical protein